MQFRDWITLFPVFLKCFNKLPASHLWYLAKQLKNENPHRHNGKFYINTFFPPYPSKAFDRFLDIVIQRKRVPFSTYFAVTDKCPFKCPHCSYGKHRKGELNTMEALEVIKQIKTLGTTTVGFTGGEPLAREDIIELIRSVGDDTSTILFTTGYRLNQDLARQLKSVGLGCIMIGIESTNPAEHDKIRGVQNSFDEAIRAINLSLKAGLYTAISTVGTRQKIITGQIEHLAELAAEYGVHEFRILEPIPTGSLWDQQSEVLTQQESQKLADFHKQWNRKKRGPAISGFSYLESDEMFGCGAGFHHLFIDAVGNVCPCDLTPLSFGNVLEKPLELIWQRMGQFFNLPRCGCFMKELCNNIQYPENQYELPLAMDESIVLCKAIKHKTELPMVYKKLFRCQKPINQLKTPT